MTATGCWPDELSAVFGATIAAEYSSLTREGRPVTVPTTPYVAGGGRTLSVSTGLTYPAKAERARRDPRVSLLFADPVGSGLVDPPVVLVQGLATVRDADLQANTNRYVEASFEKLPQVYRGQPRVALRRMAWYFARIWIDVTPLHIRWWPSREADAPPGEWRAPAGTTAPASDPAPGGGAPPPWLTPPPSWPAVLDEALGRLDQQDLSVVDADGFPATYPVSASRRVPDGVVVTLGPGIGNVADGPACLTLHRHPASFTGQENRTVVGRVEQDADGLRFVAERALADWSLAGNRLTMALGFLGSGRRLRPRLRREAERRGQRVPRVRILR